MSANTSILLLDDGELEDIEHLLQDLGTDYRRLRGSVIDSAVDAPRQLFICTPRHTDALQAPTRGRQRPRPFVRIVVVDEDSPTLRGKLRRKGFDFLVRRPVHPTALRLLLLRALYRGPERRRDDRMPVGVDVEYGFDDQAFYAVLAELSLKGCRLLGDTRHKPGTKLELQLPESVASGDGLRIEGRVVRVTTGENWDSPDEISIAVAFDNVDAQAERWLNTFMSELDVGGRSESGNEDDSPERRSSSRQVYRELVLTEGNAGNRALMGRDISTGGMRIEPHPCLSMGDSLRIAIYGEANSDPVVVDASVARDDGPRGLGLVFEGLSSNAAEQLEKLVSRLPSVESLNRGEEDGMGSVITEILPRLGEEN